MRDEIQSIYRHIIVNTGDCGMRSTSKIAMEAKENKARYAAS